MRMPDFLVIGAKKAGSTWLDQVLRSHPDVALPARRKEVAYFDLFYDRGPEWYAHFFADLPPRAVVGESTPEYMHHALAPERIERDLPSTRLVVILRSPLDRAYSEWGHQVMRFAEQRTFEQYAREVPALLAKSRYAQQLRRFPRALAAGRLHVVVLEDALRNPAPTLAGLAQYLGVEPAGFRAEPDARQNETYRPRFRRGFALARQFSDWLRAHELDVVSNLAQRVGVRRIFGDKGRFPPMSEAQRSAFADFQRQACAETEELLQRAIPAWHVGSNAAAASSAAAAGSASQAAL